MSVALVGTGLATVALGVLAFDIAGEDAGALGTALAIKMMAYVQLRRSPESSRRFCRAGECLIALDLIRGAVAVLLPFGSEAWQITS